MGPGSANYRLRARPTQASASLWQRILFNGYISLDFASTCKALNIYYLTLKESVCWPLTWRSGRLGSWRVCSHSCCCLPSGSADCVSSNILGSQSVESIPTQEWVWQRRAVSLDYSHTGLSPHQQFLPASVSLCVTWPNHFKLSRCL